MPRSLPHRPIAPGAAPVPITWSLSDLVQDKADVTVSVCIPARNEAATLDQVVGPVATHLVPSGLVDEIVVLDHDSTDDTAQVAWEAGATVVPAAEVLPEMGPVLGKGDVLWRSLAATSGDIVVWLDADLESFDTDYVVGLLGPLLRREEVALVRADYGRPFGAAAGEGGRVTEILARPVLAALFPQVAHVRQPLGGEYAIRRAVAEAVPFEPDYGVEMGLLIDVAEGWGAESIAQVDVGVREHRHRPLSQLGVQAGQVLRAALSRSSLGPTRPQWCDLRPPMSSIRPGSGVDLHAI